MFKPGDIVVYKVAIERVVILHVFEPSIAGETARYDVRTKDFKIINAMYEFELMEVLP